jgi:hypothetical protein
LVSGKKTEIFGIGTAATIAPIIEVNIGSSAYNVYTGSDAKMYSLKKYLEDIKLGNRPDEFSWNKIIH